MHIIKINGTRYNAATLQYYKVVGSTLMFTFSGDMARVTASPSVVMKPSENSANMLESLIRSVDETILRAAKIIDVDYMCDSIISRQST